MKWLVNNNFDSDVFLLTSSSHMCFEKPRLWWLLETHVAFRRLCLFFADGLVPEGGAHNVAVGEVFREFLPVGGGAQVRPAFLLQVERNLGGQADDALIVYRHNVPA